MKNLTVSIDEESYRAARMTAAERDTSVSERVRDYFRSLRTVEARDPVAELFRVMDEDGSPAKAGDRERERSRLYDRSYFHRRQHRPLRPISEPGRRRETRVARKVLETGRIGLSSQVLGEFYVNATRKFSQPLSHDNAMRIIAKLARFPVLPVDSRLVARELDGKKRHQVSSGDALILVAADCLHCRTLMSEDFSHGQTFGGVRVVNPFL